MELQREQWKLFLDYEEKVKSLANFYARGDSQLAAELYSEAAARYFGILKNWNSEKAGWYTHFTCNLKWYFYKYLNRKDRVSILNEDLSEIPVYFNCERQLEVSNLLERLPPHQGMLLYMRYMENRSIKEIAKELGYSSGTIRKYIYSAVDACANCEGRKTT